VSTGSIDGILESGFARTGEAFLETKAFSAPDCVQMCQNAVAGTLPALSVFTSTLPSF